MSLSSFDHFALLAYFVVVGIVGVALSNGAVLGRPDPLLRPFSDVDSWAPRLSRELPRLGGEPQPRGTGLTIVVDQFENSVAAQGFRELEQHLLGLSSLTMTTRVTSEGAFESSLAGAISLERGNIASIDVEGSFGGSVGLRLSSDGSRLTGGSAAGEFDMVPPDGLNEAIIIGMTRMGILHNLARLVGGQPPDHMEGGVREWVQVVDVESSADEDGDGRPLLRFDFGLVVAGQPSGTASLWIDAASRLPLRREQTVQFETGEMKVIEVYEFN